MDEELDKNKEVDENSSEPIENNNEVVQEETSENTERMAQEKVAESADEEPEEGNEEVTEPVNEINNVKTRNWSLIGGAIGGGIVLFVLIVFFLINSLSPKSRYLSLWGRMAKYALNEVEDVYNSPLGQFFTFGANDKIKVDTKLAFDVQTDDGELMDWMNNFKKLQLIGTDYIDFKNDYNSADIKLDLNDSGFINLNLIEDSETISAFAEGITDWYIMADKDNLTDIWEKLEMSGPDSIPMQKNLLKASEFSKSDLNTVKSAVGKVISKAVNVLDNDEFSKPQDSEVKYDDKTVKCKYVDLTISAEKLDEMTVAVLEQVKKEPKAAGIVIDKLNAMNEFYNQIGYEMQLLTFEDISKGIDSVIKYIGENPSQDGIVVRTYYRGSEAIRIEVTTLSKFEELYNLTFINEKESRYMEVTNGETQQIDRVTISEGKEIHEIETNYLDYDTWEYAKNEYSQKATTTIDKSDKSMFTFGYKSESGDVDIQLVAKIDKKGRSISLFNRSDDGYATSTINLKYDITNVDKIEKKEIAKDKIFDTRLATTAEVKAEYDKIVANATKFGTEKVEELKQLYAVLSIAMYAIMPMDYSGIYDDTEFNFDEVDNSQG